MRIKVRSPGEKAINLIFPTSVIFSRLTANLINKYIPKIQELNAVDVRKLFAVIIKMKRKYHKLELISLDSANGESVRIIL